MLLALALVSVLAPVWANTYLCPMAQAAQAAREQATCCESSAGLHGQVLPGQARLEPPCDCPQLTWSSDAADQTRESRSFFAAAPVVREASPSLLLPRSAPVAILPHPDRWRPASAPPAWLRNQAILC